MSADATSNVGFHTDLFAGSMTMLVLLSISATVFAYGRLGLPKSCVWTMAFLISSG